MFKVRDVIQELKKYKFDLDTNVCKIKKKDNLIEIVVKEKNINKKSEKILNDK